jgi:hypothetical protein
MLSSRFLEVLGGLSAVYLFLSIAVSHANELLATALKWRSDMLKTALGSLLGDDLKNRVTTSPLVAALAVKGRAPSYISGLTFSRALQKAETQAKTVGELLQSFGDESPARQQLAALFPDTTLELAQAERKVAQWFDDVMDRVSGAYKRKMQKWTFIIGLGVCALANADTITIAQRLWSDSTVREAGAALARKQAEACKMVNNELDCRQALEKTVAAAAGEMPIGWSRREVPEGGWDWLLKVVGILLSSGALVFGAPFWFDIVKKLGSPRGAGPAPERTSLAATP